MSNHNVTKDEHLQRVMAQGMLSGEIVAYHAAHVVKFDTPQNAPNGVKLLTFDEVAAFSGWQWWFDEKGRLN